MKYAETFRSSKVVRRRRPSAYAIMSGIGALVAVQACSNSNADSTPLDATAVNSRLAEAFCGALRGCCTTQNYEYDEQTCLTQVQAHAYIWWPLPAGNPNIRADKIRYDEHTLQQCASALQKLESACLVDKSILDVDSSYAASVYDICQKVVQGTVEPARQCKSSPECSTPLVDQDIEQSAWCNKNDTQTGTYGVCARLTFTAKIGEPCGQGASASSYDQTACALGAYCDVPAYTGKGACRPVKQVGEPCANGDSSQCSDGAYCDPNGNECRSLPTQGHPCAGSGLCAEGLFCVNQTKGSNGACSETDPDPLAYHPYELLVSAQTCKQGPYINAQP